MKVRKKYLLLIASLVWMIAGFNIIKIGVDLYYPYFNILNISLSILIFVIFQYFVFSRLVKKHTKRINEYPIEFQPFYRFFDVPSFIIMICMMTFGILLRSLEAVPRVFIAVFYSGLGTSLFLAGVLFGVHFFKTFRKGEI